MSYFYSVLLDEVNLLRIKKDKNGNIIENDDLKNIYDALERCDNITDKMLKLSIYKDEFRKLEDALNKGEEYQVKEDLDIKFDNNKEDYSSLFM